MVAVVLALVVCLGLAVAVLGLVALPARRQGREVLSERGEHVVGSLRDRTERSRGSSVRDAQTTGPNASVPPVPLDGPLIVKG